jgi:hypothetical protein
LSPRLARKGDSKNQLAKLKKQIRFVHLTSGLENLAVIFVKEKAVCWELFSRGLAEIPRGQMELSLWIAAGILLFLWAFQSIW